MFSSKSGHGQLTWKPLVFWKTGHLGEVVATRSSTVYVNTLLPGPVRFAMKYISSVAFSLYLYSIHYRL